MISQSAWLDVRLCLEGRALDLSVVRGVRFMLSFETVNSSMEQYAFQLRPSSQQIVQCL